MALLTFEREEEQYLCAAVLRPGNVPATKGAIRILARLLPLLRCAFPRAYFLVHLDGGFATPALLDFLDAEPDVRYVVAMAKNAVLARHAESACTTRAPRAPGPDGLHTSTPKRAMPPPPGVTPGVSSSRPKSSASTSASRGTTRASSWVHDIIVR